MAVNKRKTMAIVSSYNELCGNATYTEVLRKGFSRYYDVDVLALKTDLLASSNHAVSKLADRHIREMARKLRRYDYVNIQFEAGLYGNTVRKIIRRIRWLVNACSNMTFTMHRVDVADSIFDRDFLERLRNESVFQILKTFRQRVYLAGLYRYLVHYIKRKGRLRNFSIIVHTKREKLNIRRIFKYKRAYDFPITFMDAEMRRRVPSPEEKRDFFRRYNMSETDVIVGLFGFVSAYKGYETAFRALKLLPPNYKILVFGSQHPMSILSNTPVDAYIQKLLEMIEENSILLTENSSIQTRYWSAESTDVRFDRRIFFAGNLSDDEFIEALYCCDFAVLPYLETNQSGSGIASLVLESKIRALYSNNKAFFELRKYYPNCFATFDIGNYSELAYKLRNYRWDFREQIDKCLETYNLENNILFQKAVLEGTYKDGQS